MGPEKRTRRRESSRHARSASSAPFGSRRSPPPPLRGGGATFHQAATRFCAKPARPQGGSAIHRSFTEEANNFIRTSEKWGVCMDDRKAVRVGAYAAGYATIGFWQGLGWSLTGAGATLVTVALGVIFHYSIIIIGVVIVAAVALYTWRKPQGRRLTQLDLPGMGSAGPIAATADRLATLVRRWPGSLWHALNNDPALWWMPLLPWRFRSKRG